MDVELCPSPHVTGSCSSLAFKPSANDLAVGDPIMDDVFRFLLLVQSLQHGRIKLKLFNHVHEEVEHGSLAFKFAVHMLEEGAELGVLTMEALDYRVCLVQLGLALLVAVGVVGGLLLSGFEFLFQLMIGGFHFDDLISQSGHVFRSLVHDDLFSQGSNFTG